MFQLFFHLFHNVIRLASLWIDTINSILIGFMLFLIIITPLLAILSLLFDRDASDTRVNNVATAFSAIHLLLSTSILFFFWKQPFYGTVHLCLGKFFMGGFSFTYSLGIDGISVWFVILTAFMTHLCIMYTWNYDLKERKRFYTYILCFLFV